MLHRVSEALCRLIKPIRIVEKSPDPMPSENSHASADQEKQMFERFKKPQDLPQEDSFTQQEKPPMEDSKEKTRPGLTTAFLGLIQRLEEKRKSLRIFSKSKTYTQITEEQGTHSRFRKGIVMDRKAE